MTTEERIHKLEDILMRLLAMLGQSCSQESGVNSNSYSSLERHEHVLFDNCDRKILQELEEELSSLIL